MGAVGVTKSKLSDQRYVIFGVGSAGTGIALQIRDAMVKADNIPEKEANQRFWLVDRCEQRYADFSFNSNIFALDTALSSNLLGMIKFERTSNHSFVQIMSGATWRTRRDVLICCKS